MIFQLTESLKYWLVDHPSIVWFRWSPNQSWGATWPFLVTAIIAYITAALTLHIILKIFKRSQAVRLGPIPAIHYLMMSLISITIFSGMLFSAAAELRDTRWLLRRTKTTPFEWFLCFPLGMRPSGRVFFWSYIFYLSRFLHLFRTFFVILRHRKLSFFRLFNNSILLISSFLWLEFSQSFQVLGILLSTLVYCLVYGYRFWIEIGLPSVNKAVTCTRTNLMEMGMSTRKYGMKGPMISNDRHKQTPLRGPAPQNPTVPGVIRVPNPYYASSTSTQPQYMEFIPTLGFSKQ